MKDHRHARLPLFEMELTLKCVLFRQGFKDKCEVVDQGSFISPNACR